MRLLDQPGHELAQDIGRYAKETALPVRSYDRLGNYGLTEAFRWHHRFLGGDAANLRAARLVRSIGMMDGARLGEARPGEITEIVAAYRRARRTWIAQNRTLIGERVLGKLHGQEEEDAFAGGTLREIAIEAQRRLTSETYVESLGNGLGTHALMHGAPDVLERESRRAQRVMSDPALGPAGVERVLLGHTEKIMETDELAETLFTLGIRACWETQADRYARRELLRRIRECLKDGAEGDRAIRTALEQLEDLHDQMFRHGSYLATIALARVLSSALTDIDIRSLSPV